MHCASRTGEVGIASQIAGNVKDLMINDVIERIEAADNAIPVCQELKDHVNNGRICSSALEKLSCTLYSKTNIDVVAKLVNRILHSFL